MKITIKTNDCDYLEWNDVDIEKTDFSHLVYNIATAIDIDNIEYIDFSFDYVPYNDFCVQLKDRENTCQTLLALLEEISVELDIFDKISDKLFYMKKYHSQLVSRMEVLRKLEEQIYYCLGNEPNILK